MARSSDKEDPPEAGRQATDTPTRLLTEEIMRLWEELESIARAEELATLFPQDDLRNQVLRERRQRYEALLEIALQKLNQPKG